MSAEENLQRMKTLDDAWNAQNWEVFRKRHSTDPKVHWPGQRDPTQGRDAHHRESEAFFKSIENHLDNNPYRVMFGSGDWTCTIAKWKGKMIGPWQGLDGKVHEATGKTFELEFCTVALWKDCRRFAHGKAVADETAKYLEYPRHSLPTMAIPNADPATIANATTGKAAKPPAKAPQQ